jgi:hypothetical protein
VAARERKAIIARDSEKLQLQGTEGRGKVKLKETEETMAIRDKDKNMASREQRNVIEARDISKL